MRFEKADGIIDAIDNLPLKERIHILGTAISNLSPEARFTVLESFRPSAVVLIYDQQGVNLTNPCALVIYNDRCEQIDIIKSVRENADSIRHPAISLAIRRWSHFIVVQAALARNKERAEIAYSDLAKGRFFKKAQKHLQNLGLALKAASKSQQKADAPTAFAPLIRGNDEEFARYLKICWIVLREYKHEITEGINDVGDKYKHHSAKRLQLFKAKVLEYFRMHGFEDEPIDIPYDDHIMGIFAPLFEEPFRFFETPEGSDFIMKPNRFDVLLNASASWLTGHIPQTVTTYRGKIKDTQPQKITDLQFLKPEFNDYHTSLLDDCFDLPTISCNNSDCQHHKNPRFQGKE